ncbi:hypothetical protein G6038_22045 [Rhodococcus sp. 14C212]|nr:hypothetical protein [Rhodococcus sp. 14C212]NGP08110.1 hypothetical protein [Rhodococcus sp. 14C212]
MAGDLGEAGADAGDDHQFVAGDPTPRLRILVPVRGRIPHIPQLTV